MDKENDYLQNFQWKSSNYYGLPKIHKSKQISEEINRQQSEIIEMTAPADLTFRPIVGGPKCPTHRISEFLDIVLKL